MNENKIKFGYILVILITTILTWIFHEFAHWSTSELFGYKTIMQINGTSTLEGEKPTDLQSTIISISGPIITIFQAIIAFFLLKRNWNIFIYPTLFIAFYMRFLAGLMNFIMPNDEGRVSEYLGIGTFTLSIIVSVFLFFLTYKISKKYDLGWKFHLKTTLLVMLFTTIIILSDQFFNIKIL